MGLGLQPRGLRHDPRRWARRRADRGPPDPPAPLLSRPARLELTTNPGFEDVALDELRALAGEIPVRGEVLPNGLAGHLHVEADVSDEALDAIARRLRSVHRLVRPIDRFELALEDPLGDVRRRIAQLAPGIPELAPVEATFRVTSARSGTHPFTSEDVAREAGAGVRDVLPRAVRLKGGDVELRCDVRGSEVRVGVQTTAIALSRRSPGPFRPHTSLRANFAWCLLALARAEGPPRRLLDPFAGAGTILLEAGAQWPAVRLYGSDLHTKCAEGARENLAHADLLDRAEVREGDARQVDLVWPEGGFDTIVTNPPFGRRLGTEVDLEAMYRGFLRSAARVTTDDARMVVLVERRGAFNRALHADSGWETKHVRIVELGGRYPGVFVLARKAAPTP